MQSAKTPQIINGIEAGKKYTDGTYTVEIKNVSNKRVTYVILNNGSILTSVSGWAKFLASNWHIA